MSKHASSSSSSNKQHHHHQHHDLLISHMRPTTRTKNHRYHFDWTRIYRINIENDSCDHSRSFLDDAHDRYRDSFSTRATCSAHTHDDDACAEKHDSRHEFTLASENLQYQQILYHHLFGYSANFGPLNTLQRIHIINAMNYVLSLGGGFASVKNAEKARCCARVLKILAILVNDQDTMRKCDIFEGWSFGWSGNKKLSRKRLKKKMREAKEDNDDVNAARAEHGLRNLL